MTSFWDDLPQPFFILAPMEAVTDVIFRHVVAAAAPPDVYFTEFTNTNSYCSPKGQHSTRGRLEFTPDEQPIVAHIWGNRPEYFAEMAKGMKEQGFSGIDINMGCPAPNVAPKGCGSGLINHPETAAAVIAAAKEGGLPVSVKTRLGYTRLEEYHDWLAHLLRQDIANLTVHLRTKREMSKVPAHYEVIDDIVRLRDEIAPHTFLTINGDIADRKAGLQLIKEHPDVNGIMIGRGVFHNPFCFEPLSSMVASSPTKFSETASRRASVEYASADARAADVSENLVASGSDATARERVTASGAAPASDKISDFSEEGADSLAGPASSDLRANSEGIRDDGSDGSSEQVDKGGDEHGKDELLALLRLHLDLFDKYSAELEPRKFEPLKRFFKIYVRDFAGASELREQLMQTKNTAEVRAVLSQTQ